MKNVDEFLGIINRFHAVIAIASVVITFLPLIPAIKQCVPLLHILYAVLVIILTAIACIKGVKKSNNINNEAIKQRKWELISAGCDYVLIFAMLLNSVLLLGGDGIIYSVMWGLLGIASIAYIVVAKLLWNIDKQNINKNGEVEHE